MYLSTSERIRRNSSSVILSSSRPTEMRSAIVFSFDSDQIMFLGLCLKPPAYQFPAAPPPPPPQQPTHNHPGLKTKGDRRRNDCCQESNARSSQIHAGHRKRGVESVYKISPAPVFLVQRGSEVSFFFETESDLSHMLKAVIFSVLKRRVEGHHAIRSDLITL